MFRSVEQKLSETMDYQPFSDDPVSHAASSLSRRIRGNSSGSRGPDAVEGEGELFAPPPSRDKKRTTVTVTALALLITLSYVLRGALTIIYSLLAGAFRGGDIKEGFERAADEVMRNEGRVMRVVDGQGESNEEH